MKKHSTLLALFAAASFLAPLLAQADHDDDDEEEEHEHRSRRDRKERTAPPRDDAAFKTYTAECGSCHLAFPPRLLPGRSWTKLLGGLSDHFGQNAEVDAKTLKQLETFLVQNGGRDPGGAVPLRITELRWWVKEHDEIPASTYQRKAVMSPANCGACHPGASQGDFEEHAVRIPRDAPAPR